MGLALPCVKQRRGSTWLGGGGFCCYLVKGLRIRVAVESRVGSGRLGEEVKRAAWDGWHCSAWELFETYTRLFRLAAGARTPPRLKSRFRVMRDVVSSSMGVRGNQFRCDVCWRCLGSVLVVSAQLPLYIGNSSLGAARLICRLMNPKYFVITCSILVLKSVEAYL